MDRKTKSGRAAIAACVTSMALGTAARAQDDPRLVSAEWLKAKAATSTVFVPPDYPKHAVGEAPVTVDVIGKVGIDGRLELESVASSSPDPAFAAAVREVASYWLFRPSYDDGCRPRPVPAQLRVWFEVKEGKPAISFSQARADTAVPAPDAPPTLKVTRRFHPEYPPEMQRRGYEGSVEVLLRIAASGEVEEVSVVPSLFSSMAERGLQKRMGLWRFEERPAGGGTSCASYVVQYKLRPW